MDLFIFKYQHRDYTVYTLYFFETISLSHSRYKSHYYQMEKVDI